MTLKRLQENINEILKDHPEWGGLLCIYAKDDEGNDYHRVINDPTPAKVQNLSEYYLELEGYFDGTSESEIAEKDVNCIVIN